MKKIENAFKVAWGEDTTIKGIQELIEKYKVLHSKICGTGMLPDSVNIFTEETADALFQGKRLNEIEQHDLTLQLVVDGWSETLCQRFIRVYNSLPTEERKIVAVLVTIGNDECRKHIEIVENTLTALETM